MELVLLIGILIAGVLYTSISARQTAKKKRQAWIQQKYGAEPEHTEAVPDRVRNYYETCCGNPDVDEVTWNDLNMDDVFRQINNCDSSMGEELLYAWLHDTGRSGKDYDLLERRIAYVEEHEKERRELEQLLADLGKGGASYYIPSYAQSVEDFRIPYIGIYRMLWLLLLGGIAAAVAGAFFRNALGLFILGAVFVCNIIVYVLKVKARYAEPIQMLGNMLYLVTVSEKLSRRFRGTGICSELEEYLPKLKGMDRKAFMLANQSARTYGDGMEALEDLLVGVTMWHILTYDKVMKKLQRQLGEYMELYRIVGELDAAVSVGSFRRTLPHSCQPEYHSDPTLVMEEIYHPLLRNPVCNSVSLEHSCIITGSNASGKSTFIKAVAINVILGQSIHTCMAKRMALPRARMITSMAVRDDILSGESYFIKEIRYLKRILDQLSEQETVICVVDEILRGTNTQERIAASRAILEYLRERNCIAVVASHDRELTELERIGYENYHFTEQIGQEDISFDYVLRKGPADSQNAIRLLEFAGFPEDIVERARQLAQE